MKEPLAPLTAKKETEFEQVKSFASVTKEVNGGTRNRTQVSQLTFQTFKNGFLEVVV